MFLHIYIYFFLVSKVLSLDFYISGFWDRWKKDAHSNLLIPTVLRPVYSSICDRVVPKPRCLSSSADILCSRIASRQAPKASCLSTAARSLYSRTAVRHVPKHGCQAQLPIACVPGLLDVPCLSPGA